MTANKPQLKTTIGNTANKEKQIDIETIKGVKKEKIKVDLDPSILALLNEKVVKKQPKEKISVVSVKFTEEEKDKLDAISLELNTSINSLIKTALFEFLKV